MASSRLPRRSALKLLGIAAATTVLGGIGVACQQAPAAPVTPPTPQVVEKVVTQVVEKPVEKVVTQVVEKQVVVTATAAPVPTVKTTLRFMQGFQSGENEFPLFDWAVTEYNKRQSASEVTLMDTPRPDMITVFQTMSARGDAPDVMIGGPIDAAQARSGVLRSLDQYFDTPIGYGKSPDTPWRKAFNQALMDMQQVDGKAYGVPAEGAYTFVVYYNKDLFDKNTISVPKTWKELMDAAGALSSAKITPFTMAGVWPYYMQWWFFTLAQRTAGEDTLLAALYKDKKASWNQPDLLKAAEEIQQVRDKKYFVDGFQGMDHNAAHREFLTGHTAMDFVGTWFPGEQGKVIPADFKLASFSFPSYDGGKGDPTFAQLWANNIYVTSNKAIPQSVDFLKWWSSSDVQDRQAQTLGTVSARSDAVCPPVQAGACDQVAHAKGVAGYEFGVQSFDSKLESRYQQAAVKFFFGQIDAKGYIAALDDGKQAYFKSIEP